MSYVLVNNSGKYSHFIAVQDGHLDIEMDREVHMGETALFHMFSDDSSYLKKVEL